MIDAIEDYIAACPYVLAPDGPLFVGVRGDQVAHYLNKSDLILAVGSSLSPGRFSHAIPNAATKTIIHCNVDELHINKMYPTAHAVIGDARLILQALRQEVSDRTSGAGWPADNVAAEVKAARDEALARAQEEIRGLVGPRPAERGHEFLVGRDAAGRRIGWIWWAPSPRGMRHLLDVGSSRLSWTRPCAAMASVAACSAPPREHVLETGRGACPERPPVGRGGHGALRELGIHVAFQDDKALEMRKRMRRYDEPIEAYAAVAREMSWFAARNHHAHYQVEHSIEDVLDKHLQPLGVPVLYKLPLGHGKHQASIPLGVRYTLDADARTLTVDESPFEGSRGRAT